MIDPDSVLIFRIEVRANYKNQAKNIHATNEFLLRFFENLLFGYSHILKNREMLVQVADPLNDPVKIANDPINDPIKRNILQQLKQNPNANYGELADITGFSTATIKRHIQDLKQMGKIERIGSNKTGSWKIIETALPRTNGI